MKKNVKIYLVFFGILVIGFYIFLTKIIDSSKSTLPVISIVQPFNFERQDGTWVGKEDIKGRVYAVEFFFTTCEGICPKMNMNMFKVYEKYKENQDFLILSHTVNPSYDTPAVLKDYADSLGINTTNWWFLTGTKDSLYKSARQSYKVDDPNHGQTATEEFLHTQFFALVDKGGRVRGIYDGLMNKEIDKLNKDIESLLKEKRL